jgi:hypothetical protein
MLLTKPQQQRFWREWSAVKRSLLAQSWTDAQIETERHALLERAGFDSLTQVDHLAGFDRVLSELALLTQPSNLEPQLRESQMPRTRLVFAINALAKKITPSLLGHGQSVYLATILADRWGHTDLDRLSLADLTQLRNTLAARLSSKRRRSSTSSPTLSPTLSPAESNRPF